MMLLLVHVVRLQRLPKKFIHILRNISVKCVYIFWHPLYLCNDCYSQYDCWNGLGLVVVCCHGIFANGMKRVTGNSIMEVTIWAEVCVFFYCNDNFFTALNINVVST